MAGINITKNKIVMTGGAGFLGTHVTRALTARGVQKENIFIPHSPGYDLRKWKDCKRAVEGKDQENSGYKSHDRHQEQWHFE